MYYREICNLFSKTPERRNPVHDFPQAICQTIASASCKGQRSWAVGNEVDMGYPVVSRGVAATMAMCGTAGQLGRGA